MPAAALLLSKFRGPGGILARAPLQARIANYARMAIKSVINIIPAMMTMAQDHSL